MFRCAGTHVKDALDNFAQLRLAHARRQCRVSQGQLGTDRNVETWPIKILDPTLVSVNTIVSGPCAGRDATEDPATCALLTDTRTETFSGVAPASSPLPPGTKKGSCTWIVMPRPVGLYCIHIITCKSTCVSAPAPLMRHPISYSERALTWRHEGREEGTDLASRREGGGCLARTPPSQKLSW